MAKSKSLAQKLKQTNTWRDQLNPLIGLVVARVRTLLEAGVRGEYADLQWTYKFVEERYPTHFALVERRTSPLVEMDWDIRVPPVEDLAKNGTAKMAEDQAEALRSHYSQIGNLSDAIEHLAMASFRGYAHLQKQDRNGDGLIDNLEILDQWNFVRAGLYGNWWWNPEARQTSWSSLPPDNEIRPAAEATPQGLVATDFIIREVKRPIGPIALSAFVHYLLGRKDWAGFVEIYGIPGGVVIGPPNVPSDREAEYEAAGLAIAEGGSGYLPNGSSYVANADPRGVNPFRDFLRFHAEDLVLAGTGGLLTMLTESGSGTLAGEAHTDTFNKIARAEAKKISEVFNRQFDDLVLDAKFPGQPHLAYFQLAASEETSTKAVVEDIAKLAAAGYMVEPEEITERTGYKVTLKPAAPAPPPGGGPADPQDSEDPEPDATDPEETDEPADEETPVTNRDAQAAARSAVAQAVAADVAPVAQRLQAILSIQDDVIFRMKLQEFLADFPQLKRDMLADPTTARALQPIMAKAFVAGLTTQKK